METILENLNECNQNEGYATCSFKNIRNSQDEYIYSCCNRILTDYEVYLYNDSKQIKFLKKVNKNYDIMYFNKMLQTYKLERINTDETNNIKKYFIENNIKYDTGDDIYLAVKEHKQQLKLIFGKIDYSYIQEIWCKLNGVGRFEID